ncbi:MAG: PAS domain-containing sensor histidine kinase [Desulfovibrionales bacterium]|nr:MAG: PAS domain-containing sensor histidine kinase [Desulfovibrionales bacterium]
MFGWLMLFFLLAASIGVGFNYILARQSTERLVQEYIQQRRMDLQFMANLPTMSMFVMDLRLGLLEEAAFFRQELERSLMRYLEQASVTPPYRLTLVAKDGETLLDIRNGRILLKDPLDQPHPPISELWSQAFEDHTFLPSLELARPFHRKPEGTLTDFFLLLDSVHQSPIGALVFEYQVPLNQLLASEERILLFNIGWSILGLSALFGIFSLIVDHHIRPLRQLTGAVEEMIQGRLDIPVQKVGFGETRILATSFEALRQRLSESFEEIQLRNQELADLLQEQQRISSQLRESTSRFDQLAEQSRSFVWEVDADGRYIRISTVVQTVTGHRPEELLGKHFTEICPVTERAAYLEAFAATTEHGRQLSLPLKQIIAKDGSTVWVNSRGMPLRDEAGRIYGAHGGDTDITKRVQAEQDNAHLQSQLLHAHKMEAIGTMAGGIAHDFNNLLQVMNGYAQLLLAKKGQNDPDRKALEQISTTGRRAVTLVSQLLTFSRKLESQRIPMDLNHEIRETKKMWQESLPRMIQVETDLDESIWPIIADPIQIQQVLLNLVHNAADAMPGGGVLRISTKNIPAHDLPADVRRQDHSGNVVLLCLSDTGHGMDQKTLERIYDPFFTTKEVGKGTGLGLASAYGIVTSHDGFIQCKSEPGRGTTFQIFLPATEQSEKRSFGEEEGKLVGGTETVLVVDDVPEIRNLTREVLESGGYSVIHAGSGEEALDIFRKQSAAIDLVVLDLNMPGMGGLRCLLDLLAHNPLAKVLIASGYSVQGNASELLAQGAAGFIGKPYRMQELLDTVRRILEQET